MNNQKTSQIARFFDYSLFFPGLWAQARGIALTQYYLMLETAGALVCGHEPEASR
jgi:hypothetical protein